MQRSMFKSKIHRARVTQADLDYEGSATIDAALMEAADIKPHEHVHIWNVTRGTRLETYALTGAAQSGVICINGAAAHLMHVGDLVIIATFVQLEEAATAAHRPTVVLVDEANRLRLANVEEVPGPQRRIG
jgi:aspartate 1-decarboxylase